MNSTLAKPETTPKAGPTAAPKRGLPSFRPLMMTALGANSPLLAWFLITGHVWAAVSILAGFGIGLAVYGSLHLFVGRGLEPFLSGLRGQAKPATGGMTAGFALLLPLKYLVLGGLMFLLIRTGHLSLFWFAAGFLITQVSITAATIIYMSRQPRW